MNACSRSALEALHAPRVDREPRGLPVHRRENLPVTQQVVDTMTGEHCKDEYSALAIRTAT